MLQYNYMQENRKPQTKIRRKNPIFTHPVIFVVAALAVALVIIICFKVFQDHQEAAEESVQTSDVPAETASADNNSNTPDVVPDKTPAQYEGENANASSTLTGSISTAAVEGDKLIIRVTIDQLLSSTGNCTLTLTRASQTLTYQANTIDNPSSASCEGFDIPVSDLSAGEWAININISAGDRSGSLAGKVTI